MASTPTFGRPNRQAGTSPSAVGVLFQGPRPFGFAAAPTRPGRKHGGGVFPVLHGLFQAGKVRQISRINIMQNNIHRGNGG
jgi:hypothetical protein